jgi:NTE family protein
LQLIKTAKEPKPTALVMPGGGARAAYQVGVLKALAEINPGEADRFPFSIMTGTSAGALNAVALASREQSFDEACQWLEQLWIELTTDHVYRSDWPGIIRNFWRLLASLFNAGIAIGRPVALLDNQPLKHLLRERINFSGIGRNLQSKRLDAVSVTAMNYTEGVSVNFFQGGPANAEWHRWRRQGIPTPLQVRHLIASAAIPTIFPPQRIGRNYYGDGGLRQVAPISPALHLGAEKVLIISTAGHRRIYVKAHRRIHSPALGEVLGHLINSAFIDSLETDIELLEKVNELLALIPKKTREEENLPVRPIDIHVISPSEDIDALAEQYVSELPFSLRSFLKVTGSSSEQGGVNISSYLLFTPSFCKRLIELGYKDTLDNKSQLDAFFRK